MALNESSLSGNLVEQKTCYYLLLNPDAASMDFALEMKSRAAAAGIPEKYTQTSKPHITLISWEDRPEEDEWMVNGIAELVKRHQSFGLFVGKAAIVGPQWGRHLLVGIEASEPLLTLVADAKKELPKGRKGKLHLTLAYKVPADKVPETLDTTVFDADRELIFDHFTLLKYTVDRKYVSLGNFAMKESEGSGIL